MAGTMVRQTMFTAGEVDTVNWKRTDVAETYLTAAQSLLNCEVGTTGLAKKRKGTLSVLDATEYSNLNSKMFDFIDKRGNHYIVLASDLKFHIFSIPGNVTTLITKRAKYVRTKRLTTVAIREESLGFVQTLDSPYPVTELDSLDYTQDNDSIVFTNSEFLPQRLFIDVYDTVSVHFKIQPLDIYPLPAYDFNTINYNAFTVTAISTSATSFSFTFNGTGAESFKPTSDPSPWIGGVIIALGKSETNPLGYGIITNVTVSPGVATFSGNTVVRFAEAAEMPSIGSQYSIRQPAWSSTLGYPAKVLYYQNRLWFANSPALRTTLFGSKINSPINFDVGVGRDTDAIIYTIGQTDTGEIAWLNGGKQLEVFTENYEFACPQDTNTGLTPSAFSIRQQSSYGSSLTLKPTTYINNSYYASKTGKAFIAYNFTGVGLAYRSMNISAASSHLMKQPINRALVRGTDNSQDNFIYLLNPDHTITIFQFATEYKLAAFTPMQFQEDIELIDIVSIYNTAYILKRYAKTGAYLIEKMDDNVKLDSYIRVSMPSTGIITGLEKYEGYEIQVVYKNQDFGSYVVTNGQITVFNPDQISDTVFIGMLYDVEIIPMFIFAGQQHAPFKKTINQIYVDYYQSLDFSINDKLVPYQSFKEIQQGIPLSPKTDTAIVDRVEGWERFGTIKISQSSPFDLQILSIGYMVNAAVI